jgi:ubiquinone/menaquinone biosynthesis C-methylase UbiE
VVIAWPAQHSVPALTPATTEDEPLSLFDRFPWLYAFCREWLFRDHTARIVAALWPDGSPRAGSVLLELGCGPGHYTRRLAARFAQLRAVGIDRSARQLRRARERATRQGVANCRFLRDDVRRLAQPTGAADAVVASRLFTILPERGRALAEMHRVLRPGGRCFIAEPRSRLWTALPLRALWLLADLARLGGRERGHYREPARATVLSVAEFDGLLRTQPWAEVRRWHDRQYHYAVCRKAGDAGAAEVEAMAAD